MAEPATRAFRRAAPLSTEAPRSVDLKALSPHSGLAIYHISVPRRQPTPLPLAGEAGWGLGEHSAPAVACAERSACRALTHNRAMGNRRLQFSTVHSACMVTVAML